ncbi:uncharacterized protein KY384_008608 [Bacidia gigantensis]|uniref:uncharacterized protein n=1 Tax=Bacidia gigantensis TaxID=2732470 RepID=UPI001D03E78E|nr:uncharacterized protein KY384_008608 [Bacidia gigantensis]KAG8527178.1 hypothetical protein KY384_008608 [Bacidia gigantensis]
MPIEALSPTAVRALGSTQCLTDPNSLVKELVDNAIDARASAIYVEISANTLDRIQVKDNGHGIAAEDRKLVCKRYCTSKIRGLDDLQTLGGQSMGFRGEALASAIEMSGQVALSTRVEGEETAVEMRFRAEDQAPSEKRVSHPVGTTVVIADFLKNLPVRRQTATKEKACTAQLTKIRHMLQSYAFARPHVRFCLKVVKAKSEKLNWTYAPPPSRANDMSLMRDAAIKVCGMKLAISCQLAGWKVMDVTVQDETQVLGVTEASSLADALYLFQALLPKADSNIDFSVIDKPRQFISVDSRPVSSTRGSFKKIVGIFKRYFRSASSTKDKNSSTDPFMCLNIVCRPGSYDTNIEPAKDDVLFDDPDRLLKSVESFFQLVYRPSVTYDDSSRPTEATVKASSFDLLLNSSQPKPVKSQSSRTSLDIPKAFKIPLHVSREDERKAAQHSSSEEQDLQTRERGEPAVGRTGSRSMYHDGTDDCDDFELLDNIPQEPLSENDDEDARADVTISNPWAIAKFNATIRPRGNSSSPLSGDRSFNPVQTPSRQQRHDIDSSPAPSSVTVFGNPGDSSPPTPQGSSSPPFFPFPHQRRSKYPQARGSTPSSPAEDDLYGPSSRVLTNWAKRSDTSKIMSSDSIHPDQAANPTNFVSARSLPLGTRLSDIPDISQRPRAKVKSKQQPSAALKKPFIPPVKDLRDVWFNSTNSQSTRAKGQRPKNTISQSTTNIDALDLREDHNSLPQSLSSPPQPIHPDLALTLDYENRKRQATLDYRATLRRQASQSSQPSQPGPALATPPSSSPHQNRYLKAKAALQPSTRDPIDTATQGAEQPDALSSDDPRRILLREQAQLNVDADTGAGAGTVDTSPQTPRLRRVRSRTAMLPLETVKEEDSVRELMLKLSSVSVRSIDRDVGKVRRWDGYVKGVVEPADAFADHGDDGSGEGKIKQWQSRLEELVTREYKGGQYVRIDLTGAMDTWRQHNASR